MKLFAVCVAGLTLSFGTVQAQDVGSRDQATERPAKAEKAHKSKKKSKGAAAEIGGGVGSVGGGVAKGAGSAATGVGKGALDLATLHPIDAGVSVGTGAVKAGKDVTVGSVKGAGKIGKGVGKTVRKVL
ncbi:MAG TPA: hypothetical protein VKB79_15620 [Bryobacteraceae bacterium]|nr:hypothetical protein [Bryobacteraceae bacterium]